MFTSGHIVLLFLLWKDAKELAIFLVVVWVKIQHSEDEGTCERIERLAGESRAFARYRTAKRAWWGSFYSRGVTFGRKMGANRKTEGE